MLSEAYSLLADAGQAGYVEAWAERIATMIAQAEHKAYVRGRAEGVTACVGVLERKHDDIMSKSRQHGYSQEHMEERAIAVLQLLDELRHEPGADAFHRLLAAHKAEAREEIRAHFEAKFEADETERWYLWAANEIDTLDPGT